MDEAAVPERRQAWHHVVGVHVAVEVEETAALLDEGAVADRWLAEGVDRVQ